MENCIVVGDNYFSVRGVIYLPFGHDLYSSRSDPPLPFYEVLVKLLTTTQYWTTTVLATMFLRHVAVSDNPLIGVSAEKDRTIFDKYSR